MIGDNVTNVISFINDNSSPVNIAAITCPLLFALAVLKSPGPELFKINYERITMMAIPKIRLILENQRNTIERMVHNLFMHPELRDRSLLDRILTIPEGHIEDVQIFNIDDFNRTRVLEYLMLISEDKRKQFIQQARTFITTETDPSNGLIVLGYLINFSEDQREQFIQQAQTFITTDTNAATRFLVLNTIANTRHDQRENIIHRVRMLITTDMEFCDIIKIFEAVQIITDLEAILGETLLGYTIPEILCTDLIEDVLDLTKSDQDFLNTIKNLQVAITLLPNNQLEILMPNIQSLIASDQNYLDIMRAFRDALFPPENQGGNPIQSETQLELSRTEFQENSKALLLNYAKEIIDYGSGQTPSISYTDEKGQDVGGLTRDFITNIFLEIYTNSEVFNTKSIDDQGVLIHLDDAQDSEISKAIGIILGTALINQTFSIGKGFHPVLFHMIKILNQKDFQHIPGNIQSIADLNKLLHKESSGKVFTKLFDKYIEIIYPEGLAGMNNKEFLETYPEPHQVIRSIALIAKHMYNYLVKHDNGWDAVAKISHETLSKRLEGEISKQLLKTSIQSNNENLTALINNWVDSANDDQLKEFLLCATGSFTLLPQQKLFMERVSNSNQSFTFHTCSGTVEVSIDTTQPPDQATFNCHLDTSISMPNEFQIL